MVHDLSAVVTLTSVSKKLGGRRVLERLDLAIRVGGVTALLGANGAGKTTSIRLSTGRLRPDAGKARLLASTPQGPPHGPGWG